MNGCASAPVRVTRHCRTDQCASAPVRHPPYRGGTGAGAANRRAGVERGLAQPAPLMGCLNDLADRVARLAPSHRDPFAFHEEKSEIVHVLRSLASDMGRE